MRDALLLLLALAACTAGMGWLALAMNVHWAQVREGTPANARRLRILGSLALLAGLLLCFASSAASMAVLFWVMALAAAAMAIAFTLTWRPAWLRVLARAG